MSNQTTFVKPELRAELLISYMTGTPVDLLTGTTMRLNGKICPIGAVGKNTMVIGPSDSGKSMVADFFTKAICESESIRKSCWVETELPDTKEYVVKNPCGTVVNGTGWLPEEFESLMDVFNGKEVFRDTVAEFGGEECSWRAPSGLVTIDSYSTLAFQSLRAPAVDAGVNAMINQYAMWNGRCKTELLSRVSITSDKATVITAHTGHAINMDPYAPKQDAEAEAERIKGCSSKMPFLMNQTLRSSVTGRGKDFVNLRVTVLRNKRGMSGLSSPLVLDMNSMAIGADLTNASIIQGYRVPSKNGEFLLESLGLEISMDLVRKGPSPYLSKALYIEACMEWFEHNSIVHKNYGIRIPNKHAFYQWLREDESIISNFKLQKGLVTGEGTILNLFQQFHDSL